MENSIAPAKGQESLLQAALRGHDSLSYLFGKLTNLGVHLMQVSRRCLLAAFSHNTVCKPTIACN